ncbi:MAG: TIGR00725 family protein [Microcoleaceae cyanobacterium]
MEKIIIGVMGPGELATPNDIQAAYKLGQLIATAGWVLLTGGRNTGVMEAANQGAKSATGLTVGILPSSNVNHLSSAVDIAIKTNLGQGRNIVNILSSHVVIACGIGAGTASEIALAIKEKKPIILLNQPMESYQFFQMLAPEGLFRAATPEDAIRIVTEQCKQICHG